MWSHYYLLPTLPFFICASCLNKRKLVAAKWYIQITQLRQIESKKQRKKQSKRFSATPYNQQGSTAWDMLYQPGTAFASGLSIKGNTDPSTCPANRRALVLAKQLLFAMCLTGIGEVKGHRVKVIKGWWLGLRYQHCCLSVSTQEPWEQLQPCLSCCTRFSEDLPWQPANTIHSDRKG